MSDLSQQTYGISGHPNAAEMEQRFARVVEGYGATMLDGVVALLGLYLAISPWVLNVHATNPNVTVNNLVIGLALAAFGFGLALRPLRMYRLGWITIPIGAWMIISPWVVTAGHNPTANVVWNNAWVGGIAVVLGVAMQAITMRAWMSRRRLTAAET